tara:strand:+ start:821 stop:1687 length:867 start_codon:yes stop_codon:yes gene_type:complete
MKPKVVAEIGCNHKGDISIAKELIKIAKEYCSVDAVKFQKRCNKELLSSQQYNAAHPVPENSYGITYGEHREFLEFDLDQHVELKKYCESLDIIYSTSVWDITSAQEICSIEPEFIKIPSATNLNFDIHRYLCEKYKGQIQISTGMTTKDEIEDIVSFYEKNGRSNDLLIYACTSGYPVDFNDVCLLELNNLKEKYQTRISGIGFSGHHLGISVDVAAVALGAQWVERHFTMDRTWKGTDHAASLEPDGMRRLARDLQNVYKALTYKSKDILDVEIVQRDKLKWSPKS